MKAKMVGKATNCTQIRERMVDAAMDSLVVSIRATFDAHLSDCAACAKEFRQVQTLAQAIDHSLGAGLSVEPSPQLIRKIRREMIAEPHRVAWSRQRNSWLTAAGVCAALAILVLTVRLVREFNRPTTYHHAVAPITNPLTSKPTALPRPSATVERAASARSRKPAVTVVGHISPRAPHQKVAEPEIIVEPGQMQAILRLAAATQSGQIDGAKLLSDQKKAGEQLDVKPLVVTPLKIAALNDEAASASGGENGDKDFVTGHVE